MLFLIFMKQYPLYILGSTISEVSPLTVGFVGFEWSVGFFFKKVFCSHMIKVNK